MISEEVLGDLERMGWEYIIGVRMRRNAVIADEVLRDTHRFHVITPTRKKSKDPAPLKVKEVLHQGIRYVVCHNQEQAEKDRKSREAIVTALRSALSQGDKALVGNKGYRRYLKSSPHHFAVDEEKIGSERLYDGTWVLRTNTQLPMQEVALKYKQLWMVEDIFRTMKSTLQTRPIYHKCDETITGHVFCSFLALKLRKYLQDRLDERGWKLEWHDIVHDVGEICEIDVTHQNKDYVIRTETKGVSGKVFQAVGAALPPVVREGKLCTTPEPSLQVADL